MSCLLWVRVRHRAKIQSVPCSRCLPQVKMILMNVLLGRKARVGCILNDLKAPHKHAELDILPFDQA